MAKKRGTHGTHKKREFLEQVSNGLTVRDACLAVGIGRTTAYRWRSEDGEFAEGWKAAEEDGTEMLEAEARRRAMGYEEQRATKDGELYTVTRYSDNLLMFLLKGRRPEKYRDRTQLDVNTGGAIVVEGRVWDVDEDGRPIAIGEFSSKEGSEITRSSG